MTKNISQFSTWFVTDNDRAKALVKYELNLLKSTLRKHLKNSNKPKYCSNKVRLLCGSLANKYLEYLQLLDQKLVGHFPEKSAVILHWPECFNQIFILEQKLATTLALEETKELLIEIASLYQNVNPERFLDSMKQENEYSKHLKQLFSERSHNLWLARLVNFLNHHEMTCVELVAIFRDWNVQQQQDVLDYFSEPKFVGLVNAIFFYKLHPDKLFADLIHPEKLISVRMRLGALHYYIELMQRQLYGVALQNGLMPEIDYFLHDEELPQGIMIEANEEFRKMIQTTIKKIKVNLIAANTKQGTWECLDDLGRAYRFWFNPNRLIDAVMVLHQNLLSENLEQQKSIIFQEKMVDLYRQLTTTTCLDLYGYFANNDSRYLLYTFFTIAKGGTFDWLPLLNDEEKNALIEVFDALQSVMEALRMELKNRNMITEPYLYDLGKPSIMIGHRNRDAVFRAIAIYRRKNMVHSDVVEQLFQYMGEAH